MKKVALILCTVILLTVVSCKDGVDVPSLTGSSSLKVIRINGPKLTTPIAKYKISIKDAKDKEYEYVFNTSYSFVVEGLNEGKASFSLVAYDANGCILCTGDNFTKTLKKGKTVSIIVDGNEMHWRNEDWGITENGLLMLRPGKSLTSIVAVPAVDEIDTEFGIKATSIGIECFKGQTGITAVVIPSGYKSIADGAFSGCSNLVCVVIPETVEQIGNSAFSGCSKLKAITTDSSIVNGFNAASFNKQEFKLPSKISIIRTYCFNNCRSLTVVNMPSVLTTIGSSAFAGCTKLTSTDIPANVKTIESNAFNGCTELENLTFTTEVLSTIGSAAFSGCAKLNNITLPESVVSIGSYAFSGCQSFTEFKVPAKVKSINDGLFNNCTKLTKITLPKDINSIGERAFAWNSSLKEINATAKYDVVIPSGVKQLGNLVFVGDTGIKSMFVPSSVETIGYEAFSAMNGALSFAASKSSEEWDDSLSFTGFNGTTVFGASL